MRNGIKPGRFQDADGGSIFLDEIGDMPLSLQAKLLRVLEDREFYPLGGRKTVRVDIRIISATNRNLENLVKENAFEKTCIIVSMSCAWRSLHFANVEMISPCLSHIFSNAWPLPGTAGRPKLKKTAMEMLLNHDYPGNIRELENILEHALIICQGNEIHPETSSPFIAKPENRSAGNFRSISGPGSLKTLWAPAKNKPF